MKSCDCSVDCSPVSFDDLLSLLAVTLDNGLLHVFLCLFVGDDVGKFEECGLHYHIGGFCAACGHCDVQAVDGVELKVLVGNLTLHECRQLVVQFLVRPTAVKQERAAVLGVCKDVVTRYVTGVVASDEFRLVDEVAGLNRVLAEAQVADCQTAALLAVVLEVALCVQVGVVADDFDAVFVCADGTVAAQSVELATCGACGCNVDHFVNGKAGACHVVVDTYGEVVFLCAVQVLVDCKNHAGRKFLAAKAVTTADNNVHVTSFFGKCGNNVQVQGFAERSGFLCAVKHCNLFDGCGDSVHKVLCREGTIEVYFQHADLFAAFGKVIDGFFNRVCAAAHKDDDFVCVGCAYVVKQMVVTSRQFADLFHVFFNNGRGCKVVLVCCFTVLEVDVRVLSSTLKLRMFGVECACAEFVYVLHVKQFCHVFVTDFVDLAYFVAGTETVEEVQEGYACFQCGQMSDKCHVHCFLYAVACQHCEACLTACHYVLVIAEDVKCVGSQCSCRYVEHAGKQFAADLVHVGDHQQQTLACGESAGQCACDKAAVYCACSACFGFHFGNFDCLTEQVLSALGRPFVCHFRHGRRRCDGVNSRYVAECIGNV